MHQIYHNDGIKAPYAMIILMATYLFMFVFFSFIHDFL